LGRPPDSDSAETRQRLIAGARQAFAQHGFDATTNREIAEAADVTSAAIYHYFDSKADLYAAVYLEVQETTQTAFLRSMAGQHGLLACLHAALDAAVELNRTDPSLSGFLVAAATDLKRHAELREALGPELGRSKLFFRRLAREAQVAGELAADLDLRAMEDLLNIMLLGLARFSIETGDARRHAAAVDVLKRLLAGEVVKVSAIEAGEAPEQRGE
jgi:AcrR family transcriptional regulator